MRQQAPDPVALRELVDGCSYRPEWRVWLDDDCERDKDADGNVIGHGLTLVIQTFGYNSRHPERGQYYAVHHYFIVPAATYDICSRSRWLLEQFLKVEAHEACEFFSIDGDFPYAPSHGPGNDPYMIRELGSELDQRTKFTGEVLP
jgi:hypothetical protein